MTRLPRWLDPNYQRGAVSRQHEKRLAKQFGGRRVAGSGAPVAAHNRRGWRTDSPGKQRETLGGDVSTTQLHIEHKYTEHASISVKLEWLEKVAEAARALGREPALVVTFEGMQVRYDRPARQRMSKDWAMVPLDLLTRLLEVAKQAKKDENDAPAKVPSE